MTDNEEREILKVIDERDKWHDAATDLANAVGKHFCVDFGGHSSMNCPVENALNFLTDM